MRIAKTVLLKKIETISMTNLVRPIDFDQNHWDVVAHRSRNEFHANQGNSVADRNPDVFNENS